MDDQLIAVLAVTAGLTASLAVSLVIIKLWHRAVLQWRGVRTAHYVTAIGELLSRNILPSGPRPGWAQDPLFHEAIADYRLMVTGADRQFVDRFMDQLDIGTILVARASRRFPLATRLRAISSLVNLATPQERDSLRAMLDDRNSHVRINAMRGLARLRDIESIPRILDIATTAKAWEAARMADALVEMGTHGVAPICDWISHQTRDDAPGVGVTMAARALGLIGDPTAEPTLISLLGSAHPQWRVSAASALEHTGTDAAVDPLSRALDDEDWRVRARAVVALGALADPAVVGAVAELLQDGQWWVRQNAAEALSRLPGGSDILMSYLDSADRYAADAALHQLTASGFVAAAADRVALGSGSDSERALVARAAVS